MKLHSRISLVKQQRREPDTGHSADDTWIHQWVKHGQTLQASVSVHLGWECTGGRGEVTLPG